MKVCDGVRDAWRELARNQLNLDSSVLALPRSLDRIMGALPAHDALYAGGQKVLIEVVTA